MKPENALQRRSQWKIDRSISSAVSEWAGLLGRHSLQEYDCTRRQ